MNKTMENKEIYGNLMDLVWKPKVENIEKSGKPRK